MFNFLKREFNFSSGSFNPSSSPPPGKIVKSPLRRRESSSIYRELPNAETDTGWYDYILRLRINTHRFKTKFHECHLVGYPRDILIRHINYGIFINWRRAFKRSVMISPRHPHTKTYALSSYRLVEEEYRHLVWYTSAIHPFSMFTLCYESLFMFAVMWQMIALPVFSMIFREDNQILYWNYLPVNLMYIVTIILSFFTGFYDSNRNVVILRQSAITVHYLKSYFIFDLLVLLPQFLRGNLAALMGINWNVNTNIWVKILGPLLILNSYVRYFWLLRVLLQVRLYFGMSSYLHTALRLLFNTVLVLVFCTYISHAVMVEIIPDHSLLKHVMYTIKMLMLVDHGYPVKGLLQFFPVLFILIGFAFHLIMLIHGMEVWQKFYSVENNQLSLYTSTAAFMRYRALPVALRDRIYLFMDFKYQGNFYKESVLIKMLSSALRQEILWTISEEGMRRVELFQKCPIEALNKIRNSLVSQIFLPGDAIIKEGTEGNCMFFILAGTVAVTGANNKALCYLRDGSHFGEIALVINIPRVANVIAVTPCELFKLEKSHFINVMRLYPRILREIRKDANARIAKTSESILDVDRLFKTTIKRKRVFYCFNE